MVPLKSWPGIAVVVVVTLGLAALTAVLSLGVLPAAITIVGWLIVAPVLAILTYYENGTPYGGDEESADEVSAETTPMATLRERYARGDLSDEEFERRVERLLETEDETGTATRTSDSRAERETVRER